jgi:hypothetical protein
MPIFETSMKTAIFTVIGSLFTAVYWWIVFITVYADAIFAGDRGPSWTPPSDSDAIFLDIMVIVIAVVFYAVLMATWSWMKRRFFRA